MCYECGQRRRNLPFKCCTKCYEFQRSRRHQNHRGDGGNHDGVIDLDSIGRAVKAMDDLTLVPISEGMCKAPCCL